MRNSYFKLVVLILTAWYFQGKDVFAQNQSGDSTSINVSAQSQNFLQTSDSIGLLFGKQSKQSLVQSTSTIYTNQLTTSPTPLFLNAIIGRLSRVDNGVNSGAPARDGEGTFSVTLGSGSNLVIIDGVPRPFSSIDPEEIESITVLKDALATVMYGQRSTNGILLVTTKKGGTNSPRISVIAQHGIQTPLKLARPLSAFDYATLYNEALANDGKAPVYTTNDLDLFRSGADKFGHPNVDWYNTILNKNSSLSRYNVNLQGSGASVRYFVSLDYQKDEGLFRTLDSNTYNTNPTVNRYIIRSNVGVDLTKSLTMNIGLFGRIQDGNQPGNNATGAILSSILNTPRNAYPVLNPNGSLGASATYTNNIWGQSVYSGYSLNNTRDLAFDVDATQKLDMVTPGLYVKVKGSFNSGTRINTNRSKTSYVYRAALNSNGTYSYNQAGTNTTQVNTTAADYRNRYTYVEALAGYDRKFGNHNISILAVANQQASINNDDLPATYTNYASSVKYSYQDKYLVEVAGSYAGFNRFKPGSQYGSFGAAGLGWIISKEDFFKINWISNLKLRATYGKTGNANTGYYSYIQNYAVTTGFNAGYDYYAFGPGNTTLRSFNEGGLVNPDITWEKAKKLNLAIDASFFNDQLLVTAEYFNNKAYDLVMVRGHSSVILGNSYPAENIGITRYKGAEMSATWQSKIKSFSYFITGNATIVKSRVLYMDELAQPYGYKVLTGLPSGIRVGYIADGFYSKEDLSNSAVPKYDGYNAVAGDIKYVDRNADGKINNLDEGAIGSTKPYVIFGLTLGFNIKGFDFSALVSGQQNRQIYLNGTTEWAFQNNGNAFEHNLDRWTPETANTATYPRLSVGTNVNNERTSTFWQYNGNFIRLKNAEVGYTLPTHLTNKIRIPSARIFANGLNLLTQTPLSKTRSDIDPETYGAAYPLQRVFNFGINIKL